MHPHFQAVQPRAKDVYLSDIGRVRNYYLNNVHINLLVPGVYYDPRLWTGRLQ